jgi:hypothetical protein
MINIKTAGSKNFKPMQLIPLHRSLYVKGFGAAAVRELIKAAMKNFAD